MLADKLTPSVVNAVVARVARAPIFVGVIWTFHPLLGIGAAVSSMVMLALAWLNDRSTRRALERLQQGSRSVSKYVESSLAYAEVLQALGMTGLPRSRPAAGRVPCSSHQSPVSHARPSRSS